ncbi:ion transporter [Burkholderia humptydooensis MSMB43]|uniref:Ion transporter n=1 Tax=Burkholderia humptydooensis MSMB43 TaxID=441157 RepID=A0ABN0G9C6_9BURK|nr:ion transporter [Burkholderia humptydooensis MSMB43]
MRLAQLRRDLSEGAFATFFGGGWFLCRSFVCVLREWPVMFSVHWRRPSPGRGSLFFVLPKKSNQKKGASLGGQQRELRFLFPPAFPLDSLYPSSERSEDGAAGGIPLW